MDRSAFLFSQVMYDPLKIFNTTRPESSIKKRLALFHMRQRSYDSTLPAPVEDASKGDVYSSVQHKDVSAGSSGEGPADRPSYLGGYILHEGPDDLCALSPGVQGFGGARSFPAGINEIGEQDHGPPEETGGDKFDLAQRIFARHARNLEKISQKQRTVKLLKNRNKELQAHRSKSLTQIDCLDPGGDMVKKDDRSNSSDTGGVMASPSPDRLAVPDDAAGGAIRRRAGTAKMPSHEYFGVCLDLQEEQEQELVPASRGIYLRDALLCILERKGYDLNSVNVYYESTKKPVNLQLETHRLAGNSLRVKLKDGVEPSANVVRANSTSSLSGATWKTPASRTNSSNASKEDKKERKISGSQRGRRGGLSTEELAADAQCVASQDSSKHTKSRPTLVKRGGILSNSRGEKVSQEMKNLTDILSEYDQNGIPSFPGLITFGPPGESNEEKFLMEDNWRQIVDNAENLPKRVRIQQDAIWELLATEVSYIKTLRVITELFLACLCDLQNNYILQDIDTEKMFSNITEIYHVNNYFWDKYLLPVLLDARNSRSLLNPLLLREGFLKFDEIFQPYTKYCLEHSACIQYVKEKRMENDLFKAYVAWCETQKDCERLRFTDLLVKPMQRLTKYSLLLKAIHKKTDDEECKQALVEMNECVENFVCGVDGRMRQRHELERLKSIISRIGSYEPFDVNNDEVEKALHEHRELDLTCPMPGCGNQQSRQLLYETSGVKLKDAGSSSKMDVHCFLFTDMLLICKSVGKKGDKVKVIRQPFVVDRLVLQELKDSSGLLVIYLNEYKVVSSYFLLYTSDVRMLVEQIKKAQEQYRDAKQMATSETPELGYLLPVDDEDDYDIPRAALLVARSPRSSSHSSLVHSHSGSIDMSDPISTSSNTNIPAAPCPTPLFGSSNNSSTSSQGRATSFELGELRTSSLSADDLDPNKGRSHSMETRMPGTVCVTITSPRPERRAFLLKGSGSNIVSPNTLTVSVPFPHQEAEEQGELNCPTSPTIQIPVIPPPPKNLSPTSRLTNPPSPRSIQRALASANKPPLLKTKNVSGLVTHSAPPSEGPSPVHSLDSDTIIGSSTPASDGTPDSEDENSKRRNQKRACRPERRHHTADSFENMKKERDTSIHKRLSWNYGQQGSSPSGSQLSSDSLLKNKHVSKCLSSESVYSSSGVSSTGSLPFSTGSGEYDPCENFDLHEEGYSPSGCAEFPQHTIIINGDQDSASGSGERCQKVVGPPGSKIKIDVSEVKDGISSVQIITDSKTGKPSRSDLQRMKEFLLTSCSVEASEV